MNTPSHPRTSPIATQLCLISLAALPLNQLGAQTKPDQKILEAVSSQTAVIEEVAQTLWDKPEISLQEKEASALLQGILTKNGPAAPTSMRFMCKSSSTTNTRPN